MKMARLYPLPARIKSFVVEDCNGDYVIIINESLSIKKRFEAFRHEMSHIEHSDFECETASVAEWENLQ